MAAISSWTDDRTQTLIDLWRVGRSAAEIARALTGVSRNAVLGKLYRLGLSRPRPAAKPGDRRPAPVPPSAVRTRRPPSRTTPQPVPSGEPEIGLTDITGVGRHACRWPIGEPASARFALCGRPAVRGAYCATHGARAYRPTAPDHLLKLAGLA